MYVYNRPADLGNDLTRSNLTTVFKGATSLNQVRESVVKIDSAPIIQNQNAVFLVFRSNTTAKNCFLAFPRERRIVD